MPRTPAPESPSRIGARRATIPSGLRARLDALFPGAEVVAATALGPDAHAGEGETEKELGYGRPLRITLALAGGTKRDVVLHTAQADDYGHDRRADRLAAQVLAFDTFNQMPAHARALDVGAFHRDGSLVSLRGTGEAFLLTEWVPGEVYAEDLRRIARTGVASEGDLARCDALVDHLVALHRDAPHASSIARRDAVYARAIRDLVGHGEGIAGIADAYPDDAPGAPRSRIDAIERACFERRLVLRRRGERLRRTHGDFHPFNLLFDGDRLAVLDASRGCEGDPADDLAALTINHLFFGVEHRALWKGGLGVLWERTWRRYLEASGDRGVLEVIAPFFAWRGLVVASPRWYPHLRADDRDRVLRFVERVLAADAFDPAMGVEAME